MSDEQELNQALDVVLADPKAVALTESEMSKRIINAKDKNELLTQFDLFNLEQSKKNALRVLKLNTLLDKVEDQAIERFNKRPDQISNKELLDYMQVVSTQIEHANKSVEQMVETPLVSVKQQNNTQVNINVGPELSRESKDKVVDAVQQLLAQLAKNSEEELVSNDSTLEPSVIYVENIDENKENSNGQ